MFISIDKNGKLALREPDDFKRLHIEANNDVTREAINRALAPIASFDNDDFWIEIVHIAIHPRQMHFVTVSAGARRLKTKDA